jgi:hypothetical protein
VKVGSLVKPSSQWLSQAYYNAEEFGVGLIIEEVLEQWESGDVMMYHIMWSADGAFDSWEYDFELEVLSEGR